MPGSLITHRVVIAGASSLLGTELKSLLEESRFAVADFRLVDEESAAGILTEAGGEPVVIQPVEEDTFKKAELVFFTGSPAFTARNLSLAEASGARVIDLSGELAGKERVQSWFPKLEELQPAADFTLSLYAIPSAPAELIVRLALALRPVRPSFMSAVAFAPVSASAGKAGVEELESQTGQLLSFQPLGKPLFDTQVAFAMLDRFGSAAAPSLRSAAESLRRAVRSCLPAGAADPAVQLHHAPVYYGSTVSFCAFLAGAADAAELTKLCLAAGFTLAGRDAPVSNISSSGESFPLLATPQPDPAGGRVFWFWASADNVRLPAANAVKLAEKWSL
jgi:aspartate-semialdehyde dehydrogenase